PPSRRASAARSLRISVSIEPSSQRARLSRATPPASGRATARHYARPAVDGGSPVAAAVQAAGGEVQEGVGVGRLSHGGIPHGWPLTLAIGWPMTRGLSSTRPRRASRPTAQFRLWRSL